MTSYVFRAWLLPNPPLAFEPEEEVYRDIEVDGSHTLVAFHEAIFEAFERRDSHAYEFMTRGPSWRAMDDEEIDRFIEQAMPEDVSDDATARFRDPQSNPPTEENAGEGSLDGDPVIVDETGAAPPQYPDPEE